MKENNQFSNIRKFFNTVKNQGNHLHIDGKSGMDQDHYDYVTARFNKRITSTEKYVDRAQKELVELGDKVFVRENYIFSNTLICCGGYNYLDRMHSLTLAASIWILDQLTLQGNINEVFPHLCEHVPEEEFITHMVIHPSYDYSLLERLAYTVANRNGTGCQYGQGSLTFDLTENEKKTLKNSPSRMAFDAIINLLNPEAIQAAVDSYEQKIWEFYRIAFRIKKTVEDHQEALDKAVDALQAEVNAVAAKPRPNLLLLNSAQQLPELPRIPELEAITRKLERAQKVADAFYTRSCQLTLTDLALVNEREKVCAKFSDILPETLRQDLVNFCVEDPFETCFAILYLLDSGSLIPWNYYGAISVAYTTEDQLPFNTSGVEPGSPVQNRSFNEKLYRHHYSGYRWANATDVDGEPVHRQHGKNLSQIVFANTMAVFPRVTAETTQIDTMLEELEIKDDAQRELFSLLMHTMFAGYLKPTELSREEEEQEEILPVNHLDPNELAAEIARLHREVKILKTAVHMEEDKYRAEVRKNTGLRMKNENLLRELTDLREMVFLSQNGIDEVPIVAPTVTLPHKTTRKILSYGGHDSWLKAIKPLLPGVQFVNPDVQPNRDLIRNADEIWIQTNCLSHAAFYKIIDIVRTDNKQVRYFKYASAEKCAVQLAQMDLALE